MLHQFHRPPKRPSPVHFYYYNAFHTLSIDGYDLPTFNHEIYIVPRGACGEDTGKDKVSRTLVETYVVVSALEAGRKPGPEEVKEWTQTSLACMQKKIQNYMDENFDEIEKVVDMVRYIASREQEHPKGLPQCGLRKTP